MDSKHVIDVSEQSFESEVIARSRSLPVVVDFWAPWCGPCRMLGPVLERLAAEAQGGFVLAKVNTDENPGLSSTFSIRGIPAVKVFKDGQVAAEFVGAQPEEAVRRVLQPFLPSPAAQEVSRAEAALSAGRTSDAEQLFRAAIERDRRNARALWGLANLLIERGDNDEARSLLRQIPAGEPEADQARRELARLELKQEAAAYHEPTCRKRLASQPEDIDARYCLGVALAAADRYTDALETLLGVIQRDKDYRDGAARKAMVLVFDAAGTRSELAEKYRAKLANALY